MKKVVLVISGVFLVIIVLILSLIMEVLELFSGAVILALSALVIFYFYSKLD